MRAIAMVCVGGVFALCGNQAWSLGSGGTGSGKPVSVQRSNALTSSLSTRERIKLEVINAREKTDSLNTDLKYYQNDLSRINKAIAEKEKSLTQCEKNLNKCDLRSTYTVWGVGTDVTFDSRDKVKTELDSLRKRAEDRKRSIDKASKDLEGYSKKAKLNIDDRLDVADVRMDFADLKMNYSTFISSVADGAAKFTELASRIDQTLLGKYVQEAVQKGTDAASICGKIQQCSEATAKKVFETEIKPFAAWKEDITGQVNTIKSNMAEPSTGVQ